ncbi:DUF2835 family protein [Halioxenophilus sp. WMMB6]|uniref:DUF2835 family protein n=1 Tax=Halioxenophilus sp. WMMB6 TaxID=3073815 RepID=UPI00295F0C5D|nr:DUF2835 family protein [Halioxenophilus sp. WMMB6]
MSNFIEVSIAISREELLILYRRGSAVVNARALDGRRVQFPATALRPWVDHWGVRGNFRIYFDQNNRLSRIEPANSRG